ncbi:SpoIIE family protein phosphatase [Dactylosporangium sp. NPDC051541]|uniref:SpoIIE family protein phosphatase n=1 Tax=Dactylosporangium sp. NPDC051541 TaxID=3363977 RepID=UPI0037996343
MDADPLRSAVEQAPLILLVAEGSQLRIVDVSRVTRLMLGDREVAGRPLREALADLAGQGWVDLYEQVYRTGIPVTGQQWRAHITLPDGTIRELFADFSISPWLEPDGTVRGVIGGGTDVTGIVEARLEAERQTEEIRQRYLHARDIVDTLQQALLPRGLPLLPRARVAASYLLAGADTAAGGDWFDAIPRVDGTLALVVGDVVGHGVTASGVMGQLRAVLQDRLDDGAGPAQALAAADRFARRVPAARAATVCVAVLDTSTGTVAYCTAGHPPPLLVTAAGEPRFLTPSGAGPLGTSGGLPEASAVLGEGDVLLLYSDGIIERPGRTVVEASEELARVAADSVAGRALHAPEATPAERACTQTVELLVRGTGYADDITLLAAERTAAAESMHTRFPADLTRLGALRKTFGAWLEAIGVTDEDAFALQHAVGELATNAVEHAPSGGTVDVGARLAPTGTAEVTVAGPGPWREPRRVSERGRGLALSTQLVDDLRLDRSADGTVATLRHHVTRPAALLAHAVPGPIHPPRESADLSIVDSEQEAGVVIAGPVDAATAGRLQHELLYRSRGGTVPLRADLSAVTHLASAGVAALHAVVARHRAHGTELTLVAPPGSPARHVLALVALPHT